MSSIFAEKADVGQYDNIRIESARALHRTRIVSRQMVVIYIVTILLHNIKYKQTAKLAPTGRKRGVVYEGGGVVICCT